MELFERIRREHDFGIGTVAGIARKLNIHRRMVREAIGSASPKPRKQVVRRRTKLAGAIAFVDQILEATAGSGRVTRGYPGIPCR